MPARRSTPLRVAIDGQPLLGRRTGIGNFCHYLLEGLTELVRTGEECIDVGVYAVTWRMRPELERRLPRGARLLGRPMPARPIRAVWEAGLDVPLEVFTGRLDVVHGTNFVVPPTLRAGRVVSVQDLTPVRYPEMCEPATLAFPELIRRAVRKGAWVHTASRFVADEVIADFGADPDRVRVVGYGIPGPVAPSPDTADPDAVARAAAGPAGDAPVRPPGPFDRYVLAVGTVEPRKDYPGLVRAFDALAADRPDVGLVVVGALGWGAADFEAAVAAAAHRDRVVHLGYLDDAELDRTLQHASVLAYPSRYEGFGFPPLQAMVAGVPVVATAAGSIPEVVGDGAVIVPPDDVAALASALASLLDDPARAQALVSAGRSRAASFSWADCARGMAALYRDVAGA